MYLALFGCLFTLIVADGAAIWNGFHETGFLSAYLAVSHLVPHSTPVPEQQRMEMLTTHEPASMLPSAVVLSKDV